MADLEDLTPDDRAALGPNLVAIAEATSIEAALRLSEKLGGSHLEIPRRAGPSSPIVRAVGDEAAQAICQRFAGSCLYVPLRPGKRLQIRLLRNRFDWSISAIARELRCSERSVYRVLGEQDDRQLDLL